MEEKYHIEQNTVQETLVIPLYGKKRCSEAYPQFFYDEPAIRLVDRVDYDFSQMTDNMISRFGMVEVGMRTLDLVWEIKDYLKGHPRAAVVNLGCGLDDLYERVDNGQMRMVCVDFPDVIEIRRALLAPHEREEYLAADLNEHSWMEKLHYDPQEGAVFVASGVFYYFKVEEMQALLQAMKKAFPSARLAFDTGNKKALKLMLKTYIQGSNMQLDAFFCVNNLDEVRALVPGAAVSAKGYMTGYTPLDKSMPGLFRFMGKFGDKVYALRIVRVEF